MAIVKRKNGRETSLSTLNRPSTLPNLIDTFFGRDLLDFGLRNTAFMDTTMPAVNIRETKDNYQVEVAAPGMHKEDFKVSLDNNMLVISSEKESTDEERDWENEYTRREFSYQSFQRTFTLPQSVMADKISAKYENGILNISIPKTEEAKKQFAREIQIA